MLRIPVNPKYNVILGQSSQRPFIFQEKNDSGIKNNFYFVTPPENQF